MQLTDCRDPRYGVCMSRSNDHDETAHEQAFREHIKAFIALAGDLGMSEEAAEAMVGIDASAFAWRRRMRKGEMLRNILGALAIDIEQPEFEALTALSRLKGGVFSRAKSEVTIGDIAEEMAIDPSRASRLVTGLVTKGYIRRDVTQSDARRTILHPTAASRALFDAFMTLKWRVMFDTFGQWSDDDLATFERLFAYYLATMDEVVAKAGRDSQEAARLSKTIRDAADAELASR